MAKTFVVDSAIESIRQRKVCQVICKYPHEVEEFIVRKLGRTATVQTGWGAYSGRRVIILTTVLTRREAMELRLYVPRTPTAAPSSPSPAAPRLSDEASAASTSGPLQIGDVFKFALRKLGTGLSSPE